MSQASQADFIVKTGISKSAGLPDGGRFEASCGFEITLDITVLLDRDRLGNTIREAYKHCLDSVEGQIKVATGKPVESPAVTVHPVEKPAAASGTFGQWLKDRLTETGMNSESFVKGVYSHLYREDPPASWTEAGSRMNTDFIGSGGTFVNALDKAVLDMIASKA